LLWAGINLVPVTHRDTTGDGCACDTWFTDPKSGSDYRVVMLLTLAAFTCSVQQLTNGEGFYKPCFYLVSHSDGVWGEIRKIGNKGVGVL
jgi:hypothetical protein